ncbi:MAG: CDP-alcohol phosphatidyltransferase family protein [Micromonosporaceae bacterium]|nr:CDP-alcohol phosphatidyltransferase family protein [Micromonosporaceae bacterium]
MRAARSGHRQIVAVVRWCRPRIWITNRKLETCSGGNVPRAPWVRRRHVTDSPRPAGRRWAGRLRSSGSLARRVLRVRVGRRGAGTGTALRDGDAPGGRLLVPALPDVPSVLADVAPVEPLRPATGLVTPATSGTGPLWIPLLPGERTRARRIRFALVNGCTLGSLSLGICAIMLGMRGDVRVAAACLVGCVILDGMDGGLARRFGVVSPFGAQLDSLVDMCSFGVAAPVVVYAWLHDAAAGVGATGGAATPAVAAACGLVAACAAIRLARFNVSPKDGRFFCGVPTTMAAAVLGLATLIGVRPPVGLAVGAIALLALAMVSSFPYAKLARIARLPVWVWLVPVAGALLDYRLTFAGLVALYLASGPLVWLSRRQRA